MLLYSLSGCVSFSIHPCPPVSLTCFLSILLPFSLTRQTKPGSKFIIYQVALKFMVLKGWIRLSPSTFSLVWVLRATEIVSLIGLIMFGPGEAWGFISLPRNCFVRISRQRLADVFYVPVSGCESRNTVCIGAWLKVFLHVWVWKWTQGDSHYDHPTTKHGTHTHRQTFPEAWAD